MKKKPLSKEAQIHTAIEYAKEKGFYQGFACALATYIRMQGCDSIAEELWGSGIGSWERLEKYEIDEYDMEMFNDYKDQLTGKIHDR